MQNSLLPTLSLLGLTVLSAQANPPATLLELTHATLAPACLSESVVVIVDAQREYTEGLLPLSGVVAALHQTQRLLQRARAAGVPIIHIQQVSAPGRGIFDSTGTFTAFAPEAMPRPDEIIITKQLPNAFAGTSLDATLKQLGRKQVLLSGYMTHMCISATAHSALDHGYHATVIADACATRDLPDGHGNTISANVVHRVALAELADRFASVVSNLDQIPD